MSPRPTRNHVHTCFRACSSFGPLALAALVAALTLAPGPAAAQPGSVRVLINHVGYDQGSSKKFVVQAERDAAVSGFQVLDGQGRSVFDGKFASGGRLGQVDGWKRWRFLRGDFSGFDRPGSYRIRVLVQGGGQARRKPRRKPGPSRSPSRRACWPTRRCRTWCSTSSRSGHRASTTRPTGRCRSFKSPGKRADLHGGWYDASGDVSKYLSHLSFANYMNPQQTPLLVWALLQSSDLLTPVKTDRAQGVRQRMQDEALYGGDFLVRMQDPAGFFYLTIFDNWSYEAPKREICAYETDDGKKTTDWQAGMREGGGMAIAALARVSTLKRKGDYPAAKYLAVAEKGWAHLAANNRKYLDDKQENIIDDYTALLAATELYAATKKPAYLAAARQRQQALVGRLHEDEKWKGFWRADAKGERPYFHAAEAGLPVVALLRYRAVETDAAARQAVLAAVEKSLAFELAVTREVFNPFGYARQYVKDLGGGKRSAFFFPHKNESGYWWQGESARQASLAAAALLASVELGGRRAELGAYARDQFDWILGLNPYDVCMMQGKGRNNPEYFADRPNAPGGVANGITSGWDDERDITYLPSPQDKDPSNRWRWSEQWIPHGAWLMLALAAQEATVPMAAAAPAAPAAAK